jgi:hypothetical protein
MAQPSTLTPTGRTASDGGVVFLFQMHPAAPAHIEAGEHRLRCVSSGYLTGGRSCPSTIPARVVATAWERQRARGDAPEQGMFRFAWQGELWLAFAQAGEIRGVYCPVHLAERDARDGMAPAA